MIKYVYIIGCAITFLSCNQQKDGVVNIAQNLPEKIDFNLHVKPILSDRCFACHGPDANTREAGLRLDTPEGALSHTLESEAYAFVSGKPHKSEAYQRMISQDPNLQMPPPQSHLKLDQYEIAVIEKWIEQGAQYKPHWSFIPPQQPNIPPTKYQEWAINPIDHFIAKRWEEMGWEPQLPADKETLIRRVSLDLTGLPPTVEQIDAFLHDTTAGAYERLIDQLLNSPHYGEHMAVGWMDLARYADTHGYTVDYYRPAWPWRDWVISAFNQNMPYDQFVTWQLAGDLIPEASQSQILATGFNRNHAQNAEGGIVNEEFRVAYVADRTETFGTAFLGLTLQCARCHDHKYDPISQKEYYALSAFFNQIDESGQITWSRKDMPAPTLLLPDQEVEKKLQFLQLEIHKQSKRISKYREEAQNNPTFAASNDKTPNQLPPGAIAHYSLAHFQRDNIPNTLNSAKHGKIIDPITGKLSQQIPLQVESPSGKGLQLTGDDALAFPGVGRFRKSDPFSIGLWVKVPADLTSGVVFHSNKGGIIYNFKGYQVSIEENKWDIRLAHTFPYNAIHLVSTDSVERNSWQHIMLTYDGSGQAKGVDFYLDGEKQTLYTEQDNLYKDIVFLRENVDTYLKVGARWRSKGLRGGAVDEIVVYPRKLTKSEVRYWASKTAFPFDNTMNEPGAVELETHFTHEPIFQALTDSLHQLRKQYDDIVEDVLEVMIMAERENPRPTFVLERGAYDAHGEEVYPATIETLGAFPDSLPQNRLGLTQWLFEPDNPLTARVIVNRLWQQCFGQGLVKSQEDFGNQGDLPTHPQLLDWLANYLVASGWDLKATLKLIVTSATYRQSSQTSEKLMVYDPNNEWLARGPKSRLSAEMLRDQALVASGLLVRDFGGPSVKPYQPEGLWRVNSGTYEPDSGNNLYRRSLYTFWKRTVPPPTMGTFDAPTRSYCLVRRQKTSTPLQALTLMNDPQFQEASRVLGQRILQSSKTNEEGLIYAFRSLTSQYPDGEELQTLKSFFIAQYKLFTEQPEKISGWLEIGEYPIPENTDSTALAAYTVVISTLMSYDGAVYKR